MLVLGPIGHLCVGAGTASGPDPGVPLPGKTGVLVPEFKPTTWRKGIHVVTVTGLAMRLALALLSDHIHHPDKVFQYLEQGHRLVFGYGYVPWEFRFGTRSWIAPGIASLSLFCSSSCKGGGLAGSVY